MKHGVCPICGRIRNLSRHHIRKWKVFHDNSEENIIYICEQCHNQGINCLEALITERENEILIKIPYLYEQALSDYMDGVRPNKSTRFGRKK